MNQTPWLVGRPAEFVVIIQPLPFRVTGQIMSPPLAVATLTRAGYDPEAMAARLEVMLAKNKGTDSGIFKTHPPANERLAKIKAEVGQETKPYPAEGKRTKRFAPIVKV
jgi:predicted Zn-dependent protease